MARPRQVPRSCLIRPVRKLFQQALGVPIIDDQGYRTGPAAPRQSPLERTCRRNVVQGVIRTLDRQRQRIPRPALGDLDQALHAVFI